MPPKASEAIRMVRYYGWKRLRKTRGSHRQFVHRKEPGKVTIPGPLSEPLRIETWKSIVLQGNLPKRIFREYSTWKLWR